MDNRKKLITIASVLLKKKNRKKYKWHIHPLNLNRKSQREWSNLVQELRFDSNKFRNYLRMDEELLSIIGPSLTRASCFRESISPGERLALTLRFMASGNSQVSFSYSYRLGKSTVSNIIKDTCDILWEKLQNKVFVKPIGSNWLKIAEDMELKWNFPHCIGAIDGKHVVMQAPSNCGYEFYNYKQSQSIVLMLITIVDNNNYKFVMVDISARGRPSDGGIFRNSHIRQGFENKAFDLPKERTVTNAFPPLSYGLVGDEAFQLTDYLMRPYPGRGGLDLEKKVFNCLLSRCRKLVENIFGILASRFRLFRKPIIGKLENVIKYNIKAAVCIHNLIIMAEQNMPQNLRYYNPRNYTDTDAPDGTVNREQWRDEVDSNAFANISKTSMGSNTSSYKAADLRNCFVNYFISDEGSVEWQWGQI